MHRLRVTARYNTIRAAEGYPGELKLKEEISVDMKRGVVLSMKVYLNVSFSLLHSVVELGHTASSQVHAPRNAFLPLHRHTVVG
jgi:hypothetical protein